MSERIYQAYIAAALAICLVLLWVALLDASVDAFSAMSPLMARNLLDGLSALPVAVLVLAGFSYLRSSPLKMRPADISYVAATPLSLTVFVLIDAAVSALAGGTGAFLFVFAGGTGLRAAGMPDYPVVGTSLTTACFTAGAIFVAALAVYALKSARNDRTALIERASHFAELVSMEHLAHTDPTLFKEMRQRMRVAHRRPRLRLPSCEGPSMIIARALLSHLRQFEEMGSLLAWGIVAAAFAWLLICSPDVGPLVIGFVVIASLMDSGRNLTRVFRDDSRNRLVSDHLSCGAGKLLLLDSLPSLIMTSLISCAALSIAVPLSADLAWCLTAALLFNVVTVLSGGLDGVGSIGRWEPSFEFGLIAFLLVVGSLSLTGSPALLVGVSCAITLVYAALVRRAP